MGTFKKYVICKIPNYGMRKKKNFLYKAAFRIMSKEVENGIFRRSRTFRHIHMYKQPTLTK